MNWIRTSGALQLSLLLTLLAVASSPGATLIVAAVFCCTVVITWMALSSSRTIYADWRASFLFYLIYFKLPLAALARPKPGSDKVAERFELYICGVEVANAFGELTDVTEQRARFEAAMAEKQRIHHEGYPVDEDFMDALGRMPQASGIALGLDRLVMLATGAQHIDQVIWTPVVEP